MEKEKVPGAPLNGSKRKVLNLVWRNTKKLTNTAKKKGYEVDQDSWDAEISFGQRKPSVGKTVSKKVKLTKDGKEQKKQLHIQVYGMDSGKYELNMYIEEVELEEGTWAMPDSQKKYDQLMKLMQKKIPAGKAAKILYNFTGDDALFDAIGEKEKEDKNGDVRPMVNHFLELPNTIKYMKKHGIKINEQ